jgi:hypothetical protein
VVDEGFDGAVVLLVTEAMVVGGSVALETFDVLVVWLLAITVGINETIAEVTFDWCVVVGGVVVNETFDSPVVCWEMLVVVAEILVCCVVVFTADMIVVEGTTTVVEMFIGFVVVLNKTVDWIATVVEFEKVDTMIGGTAVVAEILDCCVDNKALVGRVVAFATVTGVDGTTMTVAFAVVTTVEGATVFGKVLSCLVVVNVVVTEYAVDAFVTVFGACGVVGDAVVGNCDDNGDEVSTVVGACGVVGDAVVGNFDV